MDQVLKNDEIILNRSIINLQIRIIGSKDNLLATSELEKLNLISMVFLFK